MFPSTWLILFLTTTNQYLVHFHGEKFTFSFSQHSNNNLKCWLQKHETPHIMRKVFVAVRKYIHLPPTLL